MPFAPENMDMMTVTLDHKEEGHSLGLGEKKAKESFFLRSYLSKAKAASQLTMTELQMSMKSGINCYLGNPVSFICSHSFYLKEAQISININISIRNTKRSH